MARLLGGNRLDLTLTEDESLIERTFAKFLDAESGAARVRAAEPLGFDPALWEQTIATRAHIMGVPEAMAGSGASPMALVLVAQQAGRHLAPVPLVESMTASNLLARLDARDLISEIDAGAIAMLAVRP